MKNILFCAACLLVLLCGFDSHAEGQTGQMSVEVREVFVKTTPNYVAPSAGKLSYGSSAEVTGDQGNWFRIASPIAGWVPKSALTSHKVTVNPDQKHGATARSHDEVALAGKGFSPQVEDEYKRNHAELARAFAIVDRVETFGATDAELRQFQAQGKLQHR